MAITKASEIIKDLSDGDTIYVDEEIENVINRCCVCGTYHHIKIRRTGGILKMTWTKLDCDPDIEDPRELIIVKEEQ